MFGIPDGSQANGYVKRRRKPGKRTDFMNGPAVIARREQALARLEDEHRAVIILRDMESLDYNQIAEVLDVPSGTVKSRLHRARSALREILGPMLGIAK